MSKTSTSGVQTRRAQFIDEFRPSHFIPMLTAGIIAGLLNSIAAISYGALIFSGSLSSYAAQGIGLALMSTLISSAIIGFLTSQPGIIGGSQDIPAAIIASMAASITGSLAVGAASQSTYTTIVAMMIITTLLTGACFIALGAFELGSLVRFLPYPVVGGFLAGTGWLLVTGAIGLMANVTPSLAEAAILVRGDVLVRWLPGVLFAMGLLAILIRKPHFAVTPSMIVGGIGVFYLIAWLARVSFEQLSATGWLLGPFPSQQLWQPFNINDLGLVQWSAIGAQIPNIGAIIVLSSVGLLLNITGLEAIAQRDIDLNRELRAAGFANLVGGSLGGYVGYQPIGVSALNLRSGSNSRLIGLIAAGVGGLALLFGPAFLALLPKVIVGGLLLYLGLDLLKEWVYDAFFRLPRAEYAIVIFIMVVIAAVGFLQGVVVGIVATIIIFVIAYSRVDVVRHRLTGEVVQSRVTRSPALRQQLRQLGPRLAIMQLQGFIFFGTADRLLGQVRERINRHDISALRFALLDFQRVTGLDSTGMVSFEKMKHAAEAAGTTIVITDAIPVIRNQMERGGLHANAHVQFFRTLDQGIEWCENILLREENIGQADQPTALVQQLVAIAPDVRELVDLLPYLERCEMAPGTHLIVQGDAPDSLFFIESGQITAQLEYPDREPVRLETMGSGRVVGEIGFYLGQARTASVVADVPSIVYRLSRETLTRMEHESPETASALHRVIVHLLSERLTHMIGTVNALQQ